MAVAGRGAAEESAPPLAGEGSVKGTWGSVPSGVQRLRSPPVAPRPREAAAQRSRRAFTLARMVWNPRDQEDPLCEPTAWSSFHFILKRTIDHI